MSAAAGRDLRFIEAARTLAMVVVVWSHASNTVFFREGDFSVTPLFTSCLVTLAVPAFFCISGYLQALFGTAPGKSPATRPLRQIKKIVIPFLAWNAVTVLVLRGLYDLPLLSLTALADLFTGAAQLYYLFALLQLLALTALANPFATPRRLAAWTAGAAGVTLAFYAASTVCLYANPPTSHAFELWAIKCGPVWLGFFFLGAWLARHGEALGTLTRRWPLLLALAAAAFVVYWAEVDHEARTLGANYRQYFLLSGLLFQVAGSLSLLTACRAAEVRGGRVFAVLAAAGRDTLGIYLAHYALVLVFYALLPAPVAPALRLPVGAAAMLISFGGSLALTRLARRHPESRLARIFFAV
ncbi:MAG: acyltransferase family protein [Acidobacteriota bacterium]